MDTQEAKRIIRPLLGDYRFNHSVCVSEAAKKLAKQYGANVEKAEMAGMLHDIMKDIPCERQLQLMAEYGIVLTPLEQHAPKLWHAMLGAGYLRNALGIDDQELLDSVRYHTTGRANMTLMDKIIFTADFISADRTYSNVEKFRKLAKKDLPKVMEAELAYTIEKLAKDGVPIHPDTFAAYNEITLQKLTEKKG
ncbi:MAG: bis(5'-nucleosyl)-tetraphosphatase (symmetrical) YqeK [Oscillospiraceae bacterium]|nr:bis(5'-nucleosyl)-tetraphosphatase (symmetrical) YqeK [Oscillospiraceae bacterium]MDD3261819.1 bis(5'-nucleosyl)-tetraphosphatase (symmetrical) YqeK [Oscillospiraceae bacterium]